MIQYSHNSFWNMLGGYCEVSTRAGREQLHELGRSQPTLSLWIVVKWIHECMLSSQESWVRSSLETLAMTSDQITPFRSHASYMFRDTRHARDQNGVTWLDVKAMKWLLFHVISWNVHVNSLTARFSNLRHPGLFRLNLQIYTYHYLQWKKAFQS